MSQPFDVVGYAYAADIWCPDCALIEAETRLLGERQGEVSLDPYTDLARLARDRGIDWTDEASYDSDDFPKVLFRDQAEEGERCNRCGEELTT